MNYIPKKLPKGTTREQWERYAHEMDKHEHYYALIRPKTESFAEFKDYNAALTEWLMNKSCFEPNKPGYYRANND